MTKWFTAIMIAPCQWDKPDHLIGMTWKPPMGSVAWPGNGGIITLGTSSSTCVGFVCRVWRWYPKIAVLFREHDNDP